MTASSTASCTVYAHPPIAASSTASLSLQARSVSGGYGSSCASIAAPPTKCSESSKSTPSREPAFCNSAVATFIISGPMPSPGNVQMRCAHGATRRLDLSDFPATWLWNARRRCAISADEAPSVYRAPPCSGAHNARTRADNIFTLRLHTGSVRQMNKCKFQVHSVLGARVRFRQHCPRGLL